MALVFLEFCKTDLMWALNCELNNVAKVQIDLKNYFQLPTKCFKAKEKYYIWLLDSILQFQSWQIFGFDKKSCSKNMYYPYSK